MSTNEGLQSLSAYAKTSKYAHYVKKHKRRETWAESTKRVFDMHREKFKDIPEVLDMLPEIEQAVVDERILGSMRAAQHGGVELLGRKQDQKIYNCLFTYMDRVEVFGQLHHSLLCGCGAGYSVQLHHVEKLPQIFKPRAVKGFPLGKRYVVRDSIEGWADATQALMESYFSPYGEQLWFDYSQVRPKGSPISSGVGTAPGPAALAEALIKVNGILANVAKNEAGVLRPIHCHDILCHIADSVMSGGVRRAAMIALFSPEDKEMATCKEGDWYDKNPQRARSNNSAVFVKDETTKEEFYQFIDMVGGSLKSFGEPGFAFFSSKEHGANPCFEIGFKPMLDDGRTGVQFCNLSTINGGAIDNPEQLYKACELASALCTLQASYTDFEYLGNVSEQITRREALIGVSMTGIADCLILNDPEVVKRGATIVKMTNQRVAKMIGINFAARTTCVKPEGTSSTVLQTSSGVHPWHSHRFIRRVRGGADEPLLKYIQQVNPAMVEEVSGGLIVSFPCMVKQGAKVRSESSAVDLLDTVAFFKKNWVDAGKNEDLCVDSNLTNNVSNTINVEPDEWDAAIEKVWEGRDVYCGVAMLPSSGDMEYEHAPFSEVLSRKELIGKYGFFTFVLSLLSVLFLQWNKKIARPSNDYEACCIMLNRLEQYEHIVEEYEHINFANVIEENGDGVKIGDTVACSGGACDI